MTMKTFLWIVLSLGEEMVEFFSRLFGTESWPARWYCGKWTDFHGWVYIISDLAIWMAYFAIPVFLLRFVTQKRDIPLPRVFWLFGAFILLCGLTHLIDASMFWWPAYRLNALVRFLTACVSWLTVFSLIKLLPQAFALRTSGEFETELTKRKETEASLIEAKEKAENSERSKELFLANMSHEIRTPMNAIMGFATLLTDSKLTKEQEEWVHAIKYSSDNLLHIINDILDFSKIEAGKLELEEKHINLGDVVQSSVSMFRTKAKEKKIGLDYTMDPAIPNIVSGDAIRLNQVLLNLLSNAIKFTDKGQIKLEVKRMKRADSSIWVEFSISDTGIGIPSEQLSSLFESFTQASKEIANKYGGTGLGLAITKRLVELQGGTIQAVSIDKQGSCFTFNLPFGEVKDFERHIEAASSAVDFSKVAGKRVLLVEDNALNQQLAKLVLGKWKIDISIAENGKVAVEMLEKENYDLILMDIQMPEMDGYAATAYIRATLQNKIPIIAMTAHALTDEKEKCLKAGMNDYVSKPFSPQELLGKINKYTTGK